MHSPLSAAFLHHFGLTRPEEPDAAFLERLSRSFARLPYENLTKIIKITEEGTPERALRDPNEVLGDHVRLGTGGTCFSLTALLMHLLRAYGYEVRPVLADRPYGADTHCTVLVTLEGTEHLLDPGYLVVRPIPLDGVGTIRVPTPFNDIILKAEKFLHRPVEIFCDPDFPLIAIHISIPEYSLFLDYCPNSPLYFKFKHNNNNLS